MILPFMILPCLPHRSLLRLSYLFAIVCLALLPAGRNLAAESAEPPHFERDVLPLLRAHCLKCHGLEHLKAGLDLRTIPLMLKGGEHGSVLVSGSPDESLLFKMVSTRTMPPPGELPLNDMQIQLVRDWISAGLSTTEAREAASEAKIGASDESHRDFWSFRRLVSPPVPSIPSTLPAGSRATALHRVRTPIDAFVLANLAEKGLRFSPDADPITLVRRAYLDLIGLPPSPREVDEFLADTEPEAYERLLDRLLASPHYGERWGRHWLDLAGYADTLGGDNDAAIIRMADGKWRYRDYVVRSFNSDRPYDRFLIEQLAGDELVDWRSAAHFTPEVLDLLVATGFLRNAPDTTGEPELNTAVTRYQVLSDTIQIATSTILGLTVNCARCHSHKFDPISQIDYYRLMAIFTPALNPQNWQPPPDRALPDVAPAVKAEIDQQNAEIDGKVAELATQLAELRRPYEAKLFETKLAAIPEPIRADTKGAIESPADQRTEIQKYLAAKFEASLKVSADEIAGALSDIDKATTARINSDISALGAHKRSFGRIQAFVDVGPPLPTFLLRRGDYETPGPEVEPGFLSVLCENSLGPASGPDPSSPAPYCGGERERTSGRRLALARWLTDPNSRAAGLVARVMINRIWEHHFGQGIVATSDNLGVAGSPPTHPELLEALAAQFIESGWRIKPMQKLIMTSTVYRQSSSPVGSSGAENDEPPQDAMANGPTIDPDNVLLWRQRLRRLESEVIRDSILATSGDLDRTIGGPPIPLENRPDGMVIVAEKGLPTPTSLYRRSLYLLARRNYHPTMLAVFDQPVLATNCTHRTNSAVSLQSLAMLNDGFVQEQADHFARRVAAATVAAPDQRIELAFRIALGRKPTPFEAEGANALLQRQSERYATSSPQLAAEQTALKALANVCHMLMNTNEFLYVE